MEEKELKFKQLQRMRELSLRNRTVDRRDSNFAYHTHNINVSNKKEIVSK